MMSSMANQQISVLATASEQPVFRVSVMPWGALVFSGFSRRLEVCILQIKSALGITDCTERRVFRRGKKILSKPREPSEGEPFYKGISLTLMVAVLPTLEASGAAMLRIKAARKTGGVFVDLTDLEASRHPLPKVRTSAS